MLMLRKDVKVGLGIGAAVLAVGVLYFVLSNLGSSDPKLADSSATPGSTSARLGITPATKPATLTPAGGSGENIKINVPPPVAPTKTTSITPGGADVNDPWGDAFNRGAVVAVTRTPDSRVPATNPSTLTQVRTDISNGSGLMGVRPTQPVAITQVDRPLESTSGQIPSGNSPASELGKEHVVKTGETFSSISEIYYGSANKYDIIQDANKSVNPRALKPGTRLMIPPAPRASVTAEQFNDVSIDPRSQYVIQPGDSLQKIAGELYGDATKWSGIYEFNKALIGTDPARLKVGQVLKLPSAPTQR